MLEHLRDTVTMATSHYTFVQTQRGTTLRVKPAIDYGGGMLMGEAMDV